MRSIIGLMSSRRLDPDTALEIKLDAIARRYAHEMADLGDSVASLTVLAGGRTDLLALAAGSILGGYLAEPGVSHPADTYAAGLLILAGADASLIVARVDDVRKAVEAPRYGTN